MYCWNCCGNVETFMHNVTWLTCHNWILKAITRLLLLPHLLLLLLLLFFLLKSLSKAMVGLVLVLGPDPKVCGDGPELWSSSSSRCCVKKKRSPSWLNSGFVQNCECPFWKILLSRTSAQSWLNSIHAYTYYIYIYI